MERANLSPPPCFSTGSLEFTMQCASQNAHARASRGGYVPRRRGGNRRVERRGEKAGRKD